MTEQQKIQIAKGIEQYKADKGVSYTQIADLCEVNKGYISHIINGNWNAVPVGDNKTSAISDKVFLRIKEKLGLETEVFETENYKDVFTALMDAKLRKEYRIIDGRTGAGKTCAVTHFSQIHPKETYLVKAANTMTARDFIAAVARTVGVPDHTNRYRMCVAIASKLSRETNPILIIDESEVLNDASLGAVKDIFDEMEFKVGFVLIGANEFVKKLKKKAESGRTPFPQLYSRFRHNPVYLNPPTYQECEMIGNSFGVTDKREIRRLYDNSSDFRDIFNALRARRNDHDLLSNAA
ncbi:AAA family ATPase [Rufibacter quisquiliarum]|uniref:DNA transposition AAA+ family ATPase n=1 Tax=Rufibacter quisquiliarum TaxID=1549639 RepID=A0A839GZ77_9BACT|nr:AAA family ATPase [Rufibacter quisquiliarum]MBA9078971.1 DNA transposition AAA+ family ATPase [Rufibacter quisquiliarum]